MTMYNIENLVAIFRLAMYLLSSGVDGLEVGGTGGGGRGRADDVFPGSVQMHPFGFGN